MVSLGTGALLGALADLRRIVEFHDHVRLHFSEEADLSPHAGAQAAPEYVEARSRSPRALTLQVYAHCAGVTRLYAIYEAYVFELVRIWLTELCALVETWVDLPESLCSNYRNGIGTLLKKFGGPRTAHLTELKIVDSLHKGLTGGSKLELVADAFFIDLQNLRESELVNLFSRVGLADVAPWLVAHPALRKHCEQYSSTPAGRLKELIDYRNDAAHGAIDVDEVIGVSQFISLVEFIELLCIALSEFVRSNLLARSEAKGKYRVVGRVTEFCAKPKASIAKMTPVQLKRGDAVIARGNGECFVAIVGSIQVDDVDVETVAASMDQELGLCFNPVVRKGLELLVAI